MRFNVVERTEPTGRDGTGQSAEWSVEERGGARMRMWGQKVRRGGVPPGRCAIRWLKRLWRGILVLITMSLRCFAWCGLGCMHSRRGLSRSVLSSGQSDGLFSAISETATNQTCYSISNAFKPSLLSPNSIHFRICSSPYV